MEQVTGGSSHGRSASGGFDSGLDIGAYFDRIGLEREQGAALERLLAVTDHNAATETAGESDLDRLRALLEALDIDPKLDAHVEPPRAEPARAIPAPASRAAHVANDGGAVDVVLREALEVLAEEGPLPREAVAVQVGGRVAALLDDVTSAHLIAAAGASGTTEDLVADPALAEALTRALESRRF